MRLSRALLVPALALACCAFALAAAPQARADHPPRIVVETIVPDARGLSEPVAVRALEEVYALEVVEVPSARAGDGRVVGQHPRAGARLAFRGVLRLEVGRAVTQVALPSLAGMDLAEAERALLDQGLVPVPVFHRVTKRAPFGHQPGRGYGRRVVGTRWSEAVVRQDPAPGVLVTADTKVALHVRLPYGTPHRVRVPSLHGLTGAQAIEALRALGLVPRVRRVPSVFEQETVIEHTPALGTRVRSGQAVELVVAFPARRTHVPAHVEVPDFRGASRADAYELARRAGLRLEIGERAGRRRPQARGHGSRQRPTAGVRVPLGTVIRIARPVRGPIAGPRAAVPPRR